MNESEYRPLESEHRDAYVEYTSYAFNPESGPVTYDPEEHETEQLRIGDRRGLFEAGADEDEPPRCVCAHHWFEAKVRGKTCSTPGLSAVASPPAYRRKGYVRRLLKHSLAEYRSRDGRFSLLWPFRYRFYRQYGWETVSAHRRYTCEPETLSFATERLRECKGVGGRYQELETDDFTDAARVYEAHTRQYSLAVDRSEAWWRHLIFESWESDPFVAAWERDGTVCGYLVYTIDGSGRDRTMNVRELVHNDFESLLALLAYCHNHDSQVGEVRFTLPPDVDVLDLVPDPEDVECRLHTGAMARIVDVVQTLSELPYPGVDADLTLTVEDPLVDWNDRTVRLAVDRGAAVCEPVADERNPDVTTDVGALTQLAVGYRKASVLERHGVLTGSDETISTLDRLFPPDNTYIATRF